MSSDQVTWLCVGFAGQALFTSRFLIQWIVSEKKRESVIPVAFWYLSLGGGTLLLAYAISRSDPVIILGQALGVVVYVRNLALIHGKNLARDTVAPPATIPMPESTDVAEENGQAAIVLTRPDENASAARSAA